MGWKRGPRVEYIGCRQGASLTSYRPRIYNPNDMVSHTDQVLELHLSFGPLLRGKLIPNLFLTSRLVATRCYSTRSPPPSLPSVMPPGTCRLRPEKHSASIQLETHRKWASGCGFIKPAVVRDVPWGLPLSTDHRLLCSTQPSPRVHVRFCHPDR